MGSRDNRLKPSKMMSGEEEGEDEEEMEVDAKEDAGKVLRESIR